MSIHKKLEHMVQLLEVENQKILSEIKKITDQAHGPHLSKENAVKIGTVKQDLLKQAERIESLKFEISQKLHLN